MDDTDPGMARVPEGSLGDPPLEAASSGADTSFTALRDDVTALVEDARTYAEAEIAFQKTRAGLAGRHGGRALVLLVLALVLLHIALIVLAVGTVIALAPLVTIWGGIAIVVGLLLVGVALLVRAALSDGKMLGALFGPGDGS